MLSLQGRPADQGSYAGPSFSTGAFPGDFLFCLKSSRRSCGPPEKAAYGKLIRMMSHEINNSVGAAEARSSTPSAATRTQLGERGRDDFLPGPTEWRSPVSKNLRAFMNGFAEVVRLSAAGPPTQTDLPPTRGRNPPPPSSGSRTAGASERRVEGGIQTPASHRPRTATRIEQVLVNVLKNAVEWDRRGQAGLFWASASKAAATGAGTGAGPTCRSRTAGRAFPADVQPAPLYPLLLRPRGTAVVWALTLVQRNPLQPTASTSAWVPAREEGRSSGWGFKDLALSRLARHFLLCNPHQETQRLIDGVGVGEDFGYVWGQRDRDFTRLFPAWSSRNDAKSMEVILGSEIVFFGIKLLHRIYALSGSPLER